jgi:hypothetical protein
MAPIVHKYFVTPPCFNTSTNCHHYTSFLQALSPVIRCSRVISNTKPRYLVTLHATLRITAGLHRSLPVNRMLQQHVQWNIWHNQKLRDLDMDM